jgi:hypothetical protein
VPHSAVTKHLGIVEILGVSFSDVEYILVIHEFAIRMIQNGTCVWHRPRHTCFDGYMFLLLAVFHQRQHELFFLWIPMHSYLTPQILSVVALVS